MRLGFRVSGFRVLRLFFKCNDCFSIAAAESPEPPYDSGFRETGRCVVEGFRLFGTYLI